MSQKISRLLNDLRPSRVTAEEVIGGQDLSDKTIVVTGGNSGTMSQFDTLLGPQSLHFKPILLITLASPRVSVVLSNALEFL